MPDNIGRLLTGVAVSVPLISLIASLRTASTLCTWVLWLHAGAAYSAVEKARARVEVRRVVKLAPHPVPASFFRRDTLAWVF